MKKNLSENGPAVLRTAENKFNQSFRFRVKLRAERGHSLKSHAKRGTVLYELLGIVDLLATRSELESRYRFVFASISALVKLCNKGDRKDGKHYAEISVKEALAELRARHIISPYFTRYEDGQKGFVVAPHDSLCYRDRDACVLHVPKRFECSDEDAALFAEHNQPAEHLNSIPGSIPNSIPNSIPRSIPISEKKHTALHTDDSPQADDNSEVAKSESNIWIADGAPSRGTGQPFNHSTGEPNDDSQGAAVRQEEAMNDEEGPAESIGQHFGDTWNTPDSKGTVYAIATATFAGITADLLNTNTKQWEEFDDAETLLNFCVEILREFAGQPYIRFATEAMVMDAGMKRFVPTHGRVPASWLKVMHDLKRKSDG